MKKKSEKQGFSAEICVELDKIKKYGRIVPKPKNYLEIGDCFANNKKTGNTKKLNFGVNDKGEPVVICEKRAFKLRWIDIIAIALKHSALIFESEKQLSEVDADGCTMNVVGEENIDMGGDE